MDLTIVIVSFQVRDCLQRCLESLPRATNSLACETIVVDNASTDGSAALVRNEFPQLQLLTNTENLGFAKACNQGLALAQGRYWMLLNPDTEISNEHSDSLSLMVSFMDKHVRAGVCGPSLVYPDRSHQHSAFAFPSLAQIYMDLFPVHWRLRESRLNGRYPLSNYTRGVPFQIDHPLGGALMVRAATAQQVGWLDEDYFIYAEEVDWCLRIRRAGWEIWCVPAARIIHHEARSTSQFRERMFVELWKARLTLFRKHYARAWNAAARYLVGQGMKRAKREAEKAARSGALSADELKRRTAAYDAVLRLSAADSQ
ncbi:MAG: glycosyltransferase family 2 protein [Chloroflexi bacterium]|nr:glycosyltransferase family 2 protein [Chloroflexota bacterium]